MKKVNIPEYDIFVDSDNKFWITTQSFKQLKKKTGGKVFSLRKTKKFIGASYYEDIDLGIKFGINRNIVKNHYQITEIGFIKQHDFLKEIGIPSVGDITEISTSGWISVNFSLNNLEDKEYENVSVGDEVCMGMFFVETPVYDIDTYHLISLVDTGRIIEVNILLY